jgi:hypothetical protein
MDLTSKFEKRCLHQNSSRETTRLELTSTALYRNDAYIKILGISSIAIAMIVF